MLKIKDWDRQVPSALFFGTVFGFITFIGIKEGSLPGGLKRKGFLPISTSPGDRLFIGVLTVIAYFLIWLFIFSANYLWIPCIIAIILALFIGFKG